MFHCYLKRLYEQIHAIAEGAKQYELVVVIWSCPLGADIIKVKLPTAHIEQEAARKVYEKEGIPISTMEAGLARLSGAIPFNGPRQKRFACCSRSWTFIEEKDEQRLRGSKEIWAQGNLNNKFF